MRKLSEIEKQFNNWQLDLTQHLSVFCSEEEAILVFKRDVAPKIDKIIKAICSVKDFDISPRRAKTKAVTSLFGQEFEACNILSLSDPAEAVAVIVKQALDTGLYSHMTARSDLVFSTYKHLHAFAEGLKPYGTKSRKAGQSWFWLETRYKIHPNELIRKTDVELKKLLTKK